MSILLRIEIGVILYITLKTIYNMETKKINKLSKSTTAGLIYNVAKIDYRKGRISKVELNRIAKQYNQLLNQQ